MLGIDLTLFEIFMILSINIILFIYSALSTDYITSFFSFLIFLILLIPFYGILNVFSSIIYSNNLENLLLFQMILYYAKLIPCFIGFFLFVELIYLSFNS